MRILGYRPSEVRKAIVAFLSSVLILLVALPVAGMPAGVAAGIAAFTSFATMAVVYLTRNDVAKVIDSADEADFQRDSG